MNDRTRNTVEVLSARGIQSTAGDWGSSPKLRSSKHEDLVMDGFSFSTKAGPS